MGFIFGAPLNTVRKNVYKVLICFVVFFVVVPFFSYYYYATTFAVLRQRALHANAWILLPIHQSWVFRSWFLVLVSLSIWNFLAEALGRLIIVCSPGGHLSI